MSSSSHRQLILIASLTVSALLVGGLGGTFVAWRATSARLQDPEYLKNQLESLNASDDKPNGTPPALVRVGLAQDKTIAPDRPIVGRLVEVRKVTVASEVTGNIVDLPVEEGTPVVGGETILARVDDVWCRFALVRSRARVASTEAKLKCELLDLERDKQLLSTKAVSQSQVESREATVADLQANLDEAKAAAEEESERVTRSTILAPFDGTVVAKHAERGGHVSRGTPIVDIVSRGQVDALLMVPESAINLIQVGQTLPIGIDALGEEVTGNVVSLTPYGPTASRTFPVKARVDDQAERLKVGMSITARIATGPRRQALVVSRDAVLVRPDGSTVWVALPGGNGQTCKVQPVPVTLTARMPDEYAIEPQNGEGCKILSGGSQVVIEGAERLTPGQQVRVIKLNADPNVAEVEPDADSKPAADAGKSSDHPVSRRES